MSRVKIISLTLFIVAIAIIDFTIYRMNENVKSLVKCTGLAKNIARYMCFVSRNVSPPDPPSWNEEGKIVDYSFIGTYYTFKTSYHFTPPFKRISRMY
ncbi:MAG: hypothetical protein PHQ23_17080, partial [Candidatus Wallbacteria bacterium]|nr:hypothetical protein [Candidatus Wallbacteria bacterium]